jgi:hypothetical protein
MRAIDWMTYAASMSVDIGLPGIINHRQRYSKKETRSKQHKILPETDAEI